MPAAWNGTHGLALRLGSSFRSTQSLPLGLQTTCRIGPVRIVGIDGLDQHLAQVFAPGAAGLVVHEVLPAVDLGRRTAPRLRRRRRNCSPASRCRSGSASRRTATAVSVRRAGPACAPSGRFGSGPAPTSRPASRRRRTDPRASRWPPRAAPASLTVPLSGPLNRSRNSTPIGSGVRRLTLSTSTRAIRSARWTR